jgi:hypothetical protein
MLRLKGSVPRRKRTLTPWLSRFFADFIVWRGGGGQKGQNVAGLLLLSC